jgi:polyribonucleotide nucleotidyltransferase
VWIKIVHRNGCYVRFFTLLYPFPIFRFQVPIAGVVVGLVDGEFIINPTVEQAEKSDMHLTVAGTKDAINMVEAGANEVSRRNNVRSHYVWS